MDPNRAFRNTGLCRRLLDDITRRVKQLGRQVRFMEVCGTHTVSLFRSGIRSLLPPALCHISGPGCPVCVTHDRELAALLDLAGRPGIVLATFGDMLRVPGADGRSLKHVQAEGARIEIVYSPLDALRLACAEPRVLVVFVAVGFETTAPVVAATVLSARAHDVRNFCIFSCHKRVPPALQLLLAASAGDSSGALSVPAIDAFLLPGHVTTVLGLEPFAFIAGAGRPAVVAGFEPADLLGALDLMVRQLLEGRAELVNAYSRAVSPQGNARARELMEKVFSPCDAWWRGLGLIPESGLVLRPEFAEFDVVARLGLSLPETRPVPGCRCGEVLSGRMTPLHCPLFGKRCTPADPVGPCMVSTEGSCAAWYLYG